MFLKFKQSYGRSHRHFHPWVSASDWEPDCLAQSRCTRVLAFNLVLSAWLDLHYTFRMKLLNSRLATHWLKRLLMMV